MKIFIIAAQTLDGFIAKEENHPAFWTSKEDKHRFVELTKKAGVVVMGSTTFRTLPRALKERRNIVYSKKHNFDGAEMTDLSPNDLVNKLKSEGVKELAVCGGSSIYTMFMEAGVIDTIYLTIEPIIFGRGISIFNKEMNVNLKLISQEKTEGGTILAEYKVINKLID